MSMRWPLAEAEAVALKLFARLAPCCEKIAVAGSIRRRKPDVGDIELIFVPAWGLHRVPPELFMQSVDEAALEIEAMLRDGTLCPRAKSNGTLTWGAKIRLAIHAMSGIPVDLFTATRENWINYLVCRTGPAESNMRIATAAQAKGWKWEPYSSGFSRGGPLAGVPEHHVVTSEQDVFGFVGLPYREPEDRQ